MRKILVAAAVAWFGVVSQAWAEQSVGNGGDVVSCRLPGGRMSIELLDFYEGRALRGFEFDASQYGRTFSDKLEGVIERVGRISPSAAEFLREEVDTVVAEMVLLPGIVLNDIPDSGHVAIPRGCSILQAAIQMHPQLPGDHAFTISKDLWDGMNAFNKAGLILHEAIYARALAANHHNSILTRYYNAMFWSQLSDDAVAWELGYRERALASKALNADDPEQILQSSPVVFHGWTLKTPESEFLADGTVLGQAPYGTEAMIGGAVVKSAGPVNFRSDGSVDAAQLSEPAAFAAQGGTVVLSRLVPDPFKYQYGIVCFHPNGQPRFGFLTQDATLRQAGSGASVRVPAQRFIGLDERGFLKFVLDSNPRACLDDLP